MKQYKALYSFPSNTTNTYSSSTPSLHSPWHPLTLQISHSLNQIPPASLCTCPGGISILLLQRKIKTLASCFQLRFCYIISELPCTSNSPCENYCWSLLWLHSNSEWRYPEFSLSHTAGSTWDCFSYEFEICKVHSFLQSKTTCY